MDLPDMSKDARWSIGRVTFPAGDYAHPPAGLLQLRLVRRGSSYAEIDLGAGPRRVFTRPGDLLLSLPDRPTAFRIEDTRELTILQIRPEEALPLVRAAGGSSLDDLAPLAVAPVRDALVAALFRQLDGGQMTAEVGLWSLGVLVARLLACAREAREPTIPTVLSPERLAALVAFMEAKLDRTISVDELAAKADLPRRLFAQAFRAATKLPVHQFILRLRADHAEALLISTDLPLADIAARAGFAHQAHMSRVLKSRKGATPGQIRAAANPPPRSGGGGPAGKFKQPA